MLFHTHLLLGIIFYLLSRDFLIRFLGGGHEILFFLLVMLGSILPDIDERNSKISQWAGVIGKIISFFFRHRGIFHSVFMAGLLFVLLWRWWSMYYAAGLALGYFAHLAGDMLTPLGVQIFYPFSRFTVRGPVRTGGVVEAALFLVLVVLLLRILF